MEIMPISLSSRQPWSSARFLELVWEFFSNHRNFLSCNENEFSFTHGSVWCNKRLDFWRARQSSGSTSARTAAVIDFYSKLPKGPKPESERAGGLRGRYFEGKNASG